MARVKPFLCLSILMATPAYAQQACPEISLINTMVFDQLYYYGCKGLPYLAVGLGVSAVFANTGLDTSIRNDWQQHLRSPSSDDFFNEVDHYSALSQYDIFIPLYFLATVLGKEYPCSKGTVFIGRWGEHSLRALFVGAPQQALFTTLLGSTRPEHNDSHWTPFQHTRAVSGHAFYGGLPLINLAKTLENPFLKTSTYLLSTLPALARINNDKHYFSQAFLGWWLAFSATQVVWEADNVSKPPGLVSWKIYPSFHGISLSANLNF